MAAILSCLSGVRKLALLLALLWSLNCEGRGCSCGPRVYTGTSGIVTSPYYPRNYPNFCRCTYRISVDSKYRIMLQFSPVRFAGKCEQDYAVVYDGSQTRDNFLQRLCGRSEQTTTLTSQGPLLIISFITNRSGRSRGFTATYSIIAPTTPMMTSTPTMTQTTSSTTAPTTTPKMPTTIVLSTKRKKHTTFPTTLMESSSKRHVTSNTPSSNKANFSIEASTIAFQPTSVNDVMTYNVNTTVQTKSMTNVFTADTYSAIESYIWMSFTVLGVLLLFLNGIIILICCIKRRQKRKTMNSDNENNTINALDVDDPTVIVNHTYQASDDFISSNIHSPKQPTSGDSTVSYSKTDQNTAVYSFPDITTKLTSPVYQSTNDAGNEEYSLVEKNHKYAKVSAGSNGEHVYQTTEINTSQYAGITSPVSASYQSPDMTGQYEYPSVIGRREGISSVPTSPMSDDQVSFHNSSTSYQGLKPMDSPGGPSKVVHTPRKIDATSDKNQYEPLAIKTPDGEEDYSLAVAHGNEMDSTYLQPDVFPDVRKDSDKHEYDLVHNDDYQKIVEQSGSKNGTLTQAGHSNDTYDVVNLNLTDRQKSSTGSLGRESGMYESFGVLKSQDVTPAIGESGYTEYNAESFHGAYQDLKPEESPLFGGR